MFARHEVTLSMSFAQARARLAVLGHGGWLRGPSERAYAQGLIGLAPFSAALGASRLVRVQLLEPVPRDDTVVLPLRWEATGVAGRLFPVLDADLVLTPGGGERSTLELTGAYRLPLGSEHGVPDQALLKRAAAVTVRSLLSQVADSMAAGEGDAGVGDAGLASAGEPGGPPAGRGPAEPGASA
jgi:hypothetical protein